MRFLRSLLAHFSPAATDASASANISVSQQKESINAAIARLLRAQDADLHSPVQGDCLYFASKLREALVPEHPDLQLRSVFGRSAPIVHYHLRTPEGVVIDPTWQQWLSGELPKDVPPIFVGTREELIELVRPFAQALPKRYPVLERGPCLTPEEFVDECYGFGPHAHTARDVTASLSNAHRDARSRVSKRND